MGAQFKLALGGTGSILSGIIGLFVSQQILSLLEEISADSVDLEFMRSFLESIGLYVIGIGLCLILLSIGFFVNPDDALVWRGPMATSALKQLINQGDWGALDFLLIDLPPGTSDIHLTLVQEVPVTGAIIVSTPQDVALADAIKGINMFKADKIEVPVLGLIEKNLLI